FMRRHGGHNRFKVGKSSQNPEQLQKRYEKEFGGEVDVEILLNETPDIISKLETLLIEWYKSEYTPDGLLLKNETSASSGNSDANQIYVVRKRD
ncbi:MAG: hypothetical protein K2O69_04695, partial [Odoribacter sp.]|nr:hypothetical protein [Odoribacter sp.]